MRGARASPALTAPPHLWPAAPQPCHRPVASPRASLSDPQGQRRPRHPPTADEPKAKQKLCRLPFLLCSKCWSPHPPRTLLAASSQQPRAEHGLLALGCLEATTGNGHVVLTLQGWLSETPELMEPPIETRPLLGTLSGVGGGLPTAALCSPPYPACSISTEGVLAHTLGNPGIM